MAALRISHQTELETVISAQAKTVEILRSELDAAVTSRTAVQAERDDAVAKLDARTLHHNDELTKARREARTNREGLREMDSLLSSDLSLLSLFP